MTSVPKIIKLRADRIVGIISSACYKTTDQNVVRCQYTNNVDLYVDLLKQEIVSPETVVADSKVDPEITREFGKMVSREDALPSASPKKSTVKKASKSKPKK